MKKSVVDTSNLNSRQLEEFVRSQLHWPSDRIARSRKLDMVRAVEAHRRQMEVDTAVKSKKPQNRRSIIKNNNEGENVAHAAVQEEDVRSTSDKKQRRDTSKGPGEEEDFREEEKEPRRNLSCPSTDRTNVTTQRKPSFRSQKSSSSRTDDDLHRLRGLKQEYHNLRALLCRTRFDLEALGSKTNDEELYRPLTQFEKVVAARTEKVAQDLSKVTAGFRARVDELSEVTRVVELRLGEFQQVSTEDVAGVAETQLHLNCMQKRIEGIRSTIEEVV